MVSADLFILEAVPGLKMDLFHGAPGITIMIIWATIPQLPHVQEMLESGMV
jgi:hypothetical protein